MKVIFYNYSLQVGFHDYNHRLDNLTMAAYDHRLSKSYEFLGRADFLAPSLTEHEDILNIRVLQDELNTYIEGYPFKK